MKGIEIFILIICILQISSSKDKNVDIFVLETKYISVLKIPSDFNQYYQIDSGVSGIYNVSSGSSVSVNKYGTITPKNTTWYRYGNTRYSRPKEGIEPDAIEYVYSPGKSVVTVQKGSTKYKINANVIEYSDYYVENIFDSYIKTNVSKFKNQLDKFRSITAFPAQYPYNSSYYTYKNMVIYKGGDCWASSYTIERLCQKVGLKCHVRYAVNDPGAGSGHLNVATLIDKKIYVGDAGYYSTSPNRYYSVKELNIGYSYRNYGKGIVIYQYDGYDEDINVPSTIDNKDVLGFDKKCFLICQNRAGTKIKKITLPKTVFFLGDETFMDLNNLKEVNIPYNVTSITAKHFQGAYNLTSININKNNAKYTSDDGVLFDKNKTKIIKFPSGKKSKFTGPSSLERVEEYSFYQSKNVEIVKLKKNIKYIGDYAFANSSIKEIYFYGEKPEFGSKIFQNLNVTIYYPKKSKSWNSSNITSFGEKDIRYFTWKPSDGKNHTALIVFLIIGIIIIIGVIAYIIIRKKLNLKSLSFNFDSIKGTLLR